MRLVTPPGMLFQDWVDEPIVRLSNAERATLLAAYLILDRARDMVQCGDVDSDTEFDTAWLGLSELLHDRAGNLIS